ncbi:Crp/Fnr family transcriptional regulator [Chitinophaga sp. S165]|uniref:Crp/Fnr family transcriptional regulator n=1 Tax=Chitinophaga sp. S165 TaxID=2135462 RepID=UPI000D7149CF|nr:Crp/Fnr family transcriptional regulator [Chitinophaga sp. S165]PWV51897.1 CRP-like cAMP-binding protein [Chitinophaga sp. S165]
MTIHTPSSIGRYASKFIDLTPEELTTFTAAFKEIKVKKRQFLVQPNFIAQHRYFILKGALRAYVVGEEGQDHTIQLAIEDWWISDYNSYMFRQPASMFVMAVEDSHLLQISFEDELQLKATSYKFETFFRILAERSVAFMQRRVITSLTQTAEQRYDTFVEKYPAMVNRFPQYVIASYLGMTTEFLSRIRNHKMKG